MTLAVEHRLPPRAALPTAVPHARGRHGKRATEPHRKNGPDRPSARLGVTASRGQILDPVIHLASRNSPSLSPVPNRSGITTEPGLAQSLGRLGDHAPGLVHLLAERRDHEHAAAGFRPPRRTRAAAGRCGVQPGRRSSPERASRLTRPASHPGSGTTNRLSRTRRQTVHRPPPRCRTGASRHGDHRHHGHRIELGQCAHQPTIGVEPGSAITQVTSASTPRTTLIVSIQ